MPATAGASMGEADHAHASSRNNSSIEVVPSDSNDGRVCIPISSTISLNRPINCAKFFPSSILSSPSAPAVRVNDDGTRSAADAWSVGLSPISVSKADDEADEKSVEPTSVCSRAWSQKSLSSKEASLAVLVLLLLF